MPRWIWITLAVAVAVFALDRLLLYFESRGWMYWRRSKVRTSGAVSGALEEMHAMLDPSVRAAMEAREEETVERETPGDPPVPLTIVPPKDVNQHDSRTP